MHPDQRLPDSEMEAILGVLKGNNGDTAAEAPDDGARAAEEPALDRAEES
jgi:hypothetical protein